MSPDDGSLEGQAIGVKGQKNQYIELVSDDNDRRIDMDN